MKGDDRQQLLSLLEKWSTLATNECRRSGLIVGVGPLYSLLVGHDEWIEFSLPEHIPQRTLMQIERMKLKSIRASVKANTIAARLDSSMYVC